MIASPSFALLALVLLNGPPVAQPNAATCQTGVQHVELPATLTGEVPTVCVSPGQATTLNFDSDFVRESLAMEGREKFSKEHVSESTVKLVPSERLVPGERLKLTVRFKDGDAPAGAAMTLVVHAVQATPYVEVHREKRTVASCQRELREKEAALQLCRADNERLRDEQGRPGGLIGLRASGLMGRNGVSSRDITRSITEASANTLSMKGATSYQAASRVAVEVFLVLPEDAPTWKPESATLTRQGRKGAELNVVTVWPPEPFAPGLREGGVFVEAETAPDVTEGTFTLKLWDTGGARPVTLSGIQFP
ncbi:DUF2381 family protein [Stigmatella hybrida]|uniref:DUF2381 family protein n=1 Tax=Stigmatella hybrida TaxID=394097 RepID=UPI001CDA9826|nr:DUF2381 family protein [Stigmatella hybrida]